MRFFHLLAKVCALVLFFVAGAVAQETTGGLQGTVKDPSGAVVPNAKVTVTGSALVGSKEANTDNAGYYRFANLPPGTYVITVTTSGFRTMKREGLILEVGHLPSIDFTLEIGTTASVVEVTTAPPVVDTTTNTTVNNVTEDLIKLVPHGESFQSILQFSPMARNEPLMGANIYNGNGGTGGCSPGSCTNGASQGYQVGGAADSENSYLVEGQSTNNNIGGYSHTNVPFDLIQEVEIKSSGIEAQYGGALGGVANVIMKKGGNEYHGSVLVQYNNDAMNGANSNSVNDYSRYDPKSSGTPPCPTPQPNPPTCIGETWGFIDPTYQQYNPKKDGFKDFLPGFTLGGPIMKDRLWFFVGFNPELTKLRRAVNENGSVVNFDQNTQGYYTSARLDAAASKKIRLFSSWLYDYQRQSGQNLPHADSTQGFFNVSSTIPAFAFAHGLGFTVPSNTTNVGADFTFTPRLVATTRFGYFFENYHDFGFPSNGTIFIWQNSGLGGATDANGNVLPASLQQGTGFFNVAQNPNTTLRNANKHVQFDQDVAWTKSGWWGTHNFKFGYQLNVESNNLFQRWNEPEVDLFVGTSSPYVVQGPVGQANCAGQSNVTRDKTNAVISCQGLYGVATVRDYGSYGYAESRNHGLYIQDAWTLGHGITINAGIRFDKEYLPAENQPTGTKGNPIDFAWSDKVAPRLGAAWDVLRNGKLKVFGSYGVFYDIMKLNLAISSFGGQYWQNCAYALNTSNLSVITPAFGGSAGRDCVGPDSSSQANWAGGSTPPGLAFLENQNFRTFPTTCSTCTASQEGVAPGLKPYRQHEAVFGVDYLIGKSLAFEARYDRRRLDHAIEDSAIFNPLIGETFVIVNPGQGVNSTFNGFWNFLYGTAPPVCSGAGCPPQQIIPAQRNYDGLELRLTKPTSKHWMGMFSYTYSRLWGNYAGLTTTDFGDGFAGRNAPNNSRSFDEPYFSWGANGQSSSGLLATDRPHAFKGYAYYELSEGRHNTTDFGVFSYLYSGSPETSILDVGFAIGTQPGFPVDVVGRGKWVDVTQNQATGAITVGSPVTRRTPWFASSDVNLSHNYKLGEAKAITFSVTAANVFNRRAVTGVYESIDSLNTLSFIAPAGLTLGAGQAAYAAYEHPYDISALLNSAPTSTTCPSSSNPNSVCGSLTVNSQYGKPGLFQLPRNIRLGLRFTF
jgi:Carboxypeptidase regulatory-like domain